MDAAIRDRSTSRRASATVIVAASLLGLSGCAPSPGELLARAEAAFGKGEFRAAAIDLKNLVEAEPGNAKARALLGAALLEVGDVDGADEQLKQGKSLGAPADLLLVPTCRVLVVKRQLQQALDECNVASAPRAQRATLQVALGTALLGLQRHDEARAMFAAAAASDPARLDALLGQAESMRAAADVPGAIKVFEEAPAAARKSAAFWITYGSFSLELRDAVGAEQRFEQALAVPAITANERLLATANLVEVQIRQGKLADAERTSEQLLKAMPNDSWAKLVRGQALAASGKLEEARLRLEEVVSAQPANTRAKTLLGIVLLQQGNLGQAEMYLSAAATSAPKDLGAQRALATVRAQLLSPQAALAAVRTALSQAGDDPSLLALAARLSLANGQKSQALEYLAKASASTSGDVDPATAIEIAGAYAAAGDADQAIAAVERAPSGDVRREALLLATLLRSGKADKAIVEVKRLLEQSGSKAAIRNLAGNVYAATGDRKLAREQHEAALELEPGNQDAQFALARLDLAGGDSASAEKRLNEILGKDSANVTAAVAAATMANARKDTATADKLIAKASEKGSDSAQAQLELAQYYLAKRDVAAARRTLNAAAAKFPKNAAVFNARGIAEFGAGDLGAAKDSFKQALALAPRFDEASLNLARVHLAASEPKAALELSEDVLKTRPNAPEPLAVAAAAALQAGKADEAARYAAELRRIAPGSPVALAISGDVALRQKRYRDAIDLYAKADPKATNRNVILAKFVASRALGVARPESEITQWVAAHRDDNQARAVLAEYHMQRGENTEAIRLYEGGLELEPKQLVFLNNLASLYQTSADRRALDVAARAYALAPENPAVQDTYGWILLEAGRVPEAVDLLAKAAKSLSGNASVQYHYAAALAKADRATDARDALRVALKGDLPAAERKAADDLMRKLSAGANSNP